LGDRDTEPILAGRDSLFELVKGQARLAAARVGKGRTICICGPPGVGKTAFVEEFGKRCRNGDFLNGRACFAKVGARSSRPRRDHASLRTAN